MAVAKTADGFIKIRPVRPGAKVAIIAPASPLKADSIADNVLERGVAELKRLGFEPVYDDRVNEQRGYLAGSALGRADVERIGPASLPPGPVLVHVAVDVIDASEVPGLRFPVSGGPGADTVLAAVARLVATGRVVAVDLACPWFEATDRAAATTRADLLARFVGLVAAG